MSEIRQFPATQDLETEQKTSRLAFLLESLAIVALCGLASWAMQHFLHLENGFLVFLLGVAVVAVRYGTAPSIFASFAGTAVLAQANLIPQTVLQLLG